MLKKATTILIGTLITIFAMIGLIGCSPEKGAEDTSVTIQEKDEIVMGLDDTFAPMGFRNEKNEIVGFDVDLAKELFQRAGLKLKLQPIDWSMKETELNAGNIDLIWNGYSITEERKEKVAFSQPYLENSQIIITLADAGITSKQDLVGKQVAAQSGSSAVEAMNTEPELVEQFTGGEPVLFDTNNEAFLDLEAGRVDAVVADEVLARYYIKQRGEEQFQVLAEDFGKEEYGIGMRKNDEQLITLVNQTLDEMKKDGSYDAIYEKWFAK